MVNLSFIRKTTRFKSLKNDCSRTKEVKLQLWRWRRAVLGFLDVKMSTLSDFLVPVEVN